MVYEIITSCKFKKFIIKSSLYEDGKIARTPLEILSEAIKLYSFDVDFQRDIQKNDEFEILYEVFFNSIRGSVSNGNIKYIKLNLHGNNLEYFIFKDEDGHFDYFNKKGKNVRIVIAGKHMPPSGLFASMHVPSPLNGAPHAFI